jgi:predicted nucleic acid-binding protein
MIVINSSPATWLTGTLDLGEATVIQTALQDGVVTVVLDDRKARRVARLAGLEVTGSLGVLVQAKRGRDGCLPCGRR